MLAQLLSNSTNRARLALVYLGFGWTVSAYLTRLIQHDIQPLEQMLVQSLLVIPFSLSYALGKVSSRCLTNLSLSDFALVMLRALINVVGVFFSMLAIKNTSLANVAWLATLPYPVLWAWVLYRELPKKTEVVWIALALIGTGFITVAGSVDFSLNRGAVYAIIGNLLFALGLTSSKTINRRLGPVAGYFWTTLSFALCTSVASLIIMGLPRVLHYQVYGLILVGALLWALNSFSGFYGYSHLRAGVANGIVSSETIWALLIGIIFLDEIPSNTELVGGLLIGMATLALCFQRT